MIEGFEEYVRSARGFVTLFAAAERAETIQWVYWEILHAVRDHYELMVVRPMSIGLTGGHHPDYLFDLEPVHPSRDLIEIIDKIMARDTRVAVQFAETERTTQSRTYRVLPGADPPTSLAGG